SGDRHHPAVAGEGRRPAPDFATIARDGRAGLPRIDLPQAILAAAPAHKPAAVWTEGDGRGVNRQVRLQPARACVPDVDACQVHQACRGPAAVGTDSEPAKLRISNFE